MLTAILAHPLFLLFFGATALVALIFSVLTWRRLRIGNMRSLLALSRDFEDLKLRQGDLFERFNRFQKRDGMESAREAKKGSQELLDEADALVQGAQSTDGFPDRGKVLSRSQLWSKVRGNR